MDMYEVCEHDARVAAVCLVGHMQVLASVFVLLTL